MTSLWFARRLEEKGFYWYDVPMREFELDSCRKLCNALDMLRPNPSMKGGMTGALIEKTAIAIV